MTPYSQTLSVTAGGNSPYSFSDTGNASRMASDCLWELALRDADADGSIQLHRQGDRHGWLCW